MTDDLTFALTIGVAAVCGGATGRVFALEAEDRRTAVLAAAYCGAGAGILSAPLFAFVLALIAKALDAETDGISALASAAEAVGPALLWGGVGGAGGGLLVGLVIAPFKRRAPR
jgi:hypothetical protein